MTRDEIRNALVAVCQKFLVEEVDFKIEERGHFGGEAEFKLLVNTRTPPKEDVLEAIDEKN
jgi:hypothetical protein